MTTAKRATYLVLTLPLGLVWFTLLITALALGTSFAFILLGLPILAGTIYLLRPMAQAERGLMRRLGVADIPGRYRRPEREGRWPSLQARLADAQTYKDLSYLLVEMAIGTVWTVLVLADLVLVLAGLLVAVLVLPFSRRRALDPARLAGRGIDLVARAHASWARMLLASTVEPELVAARSTQLRIVEAADAERRRIERDLHDGAQQRLVALSLKLGMARARLNGADDGLAELIAGAHEESKLALTELRDLARGIHPAVLTDRGLAAALGDLAARSTVPVTIREAPAERLPPPVEATAYFVVAESLANVAKYADAQAAWVRVRVHGPQVEVEVGDDGAGGADPRNGTGLRGLADRVGALDGRLVVYSPRGEGTVVQALLPRPAGSA